MNIKVIKPHKPVQNTEAGCADIIPALVHQHYRVSEPQTSGFGWMGFSLWYPLYHSDGRSGHVKISAVASPCETEETKPGSRAIYNCSVFEQGELRCSQTTVLPSHSSSLCQASSWAWQAHVLHGHEQDKQFPDLRGQMFLNLRCTLRTQHFCC